MGEIDSMSWEGLSTRGELIGEVPVDSVEFDSSKRGAIRATVFNLIDLNPGRS